MDKPIQEERGGSGTVQAPTFKQRPSSLPHLPQGPGDGTRGPQAHSAGGIRRPAITENKPLVRPRLGASSASRHVWGTFVSAPLQAWELRHREFTWRLEGRRAEVGLLRTECLSSPPGRLHPCWGGTSRWGLGEAIDHRGGVLLWGQGPCTETKESLLPPCAPCPPATGSWTPASRTVETRCQLLKAPSCGGCVSAA